ncbi:hypothetical protein FMUND_7417 [Fusarium mundagurra]|uniref:Uncharacterized protein n=1 Tax=Fusarium mundagurra TaxID=1567541 RepID=A0A8H5YKS8_9HYPO|nr:hypothetical protein FMUND_7417 [Fusarium mundagurra]
MPKITLDSADIDPLDTDARRQYMNVFFGQLPISRDLIQEARVKAIELQGKNLAGRGFREVNVVYFEYHVDVTIWKLIVKRLMITKNNPWPWKVSLDENDLSQGASPVFTEWCQSQTDPRSRHQGPVPQTGAEAEKMVLETIQRANELDREVFHLRRIARQWPSEDETSSRDSHGGRSQTSGAPGPSSSGGNTRADDRSDLPHASDGRFPPLAPRQNQRASWTRPTKLEDTEVGRKIFDSL